MMVIIRMVFVLVQRAKAAVIRQFRVGTKAATTSV
jgi:hypothetical protein